MEALTAHGSTGSRDPLPRGLLLFRPSTPPAVRRRRLLFCVLAALAAAALVWPVYPLFAAATPRILGLPLSLAWVVLWLLVVFGGLVWLYAGEQEEGPAESGP